ncbi:MAG: hypothetical protein ACLTD2_00825 [Ruminococcus sp.]
MSLFTKQNPNDNRRNGIILETQLLNRFLETDIGEIRIFSRDEKKQDDMRHEYRGENA